jgi:acetyl esterase/lipase
MPGLIRRTLLIGGAAAAAAAVVFWTRRPQVTTEVSYGTDPRQTLDVTLPQSPSPAPVLVHFHAGDFFAGDKSETAIWPELTDKGIAVVRVNTRLAPGVMWPMPIDDALAAVVHLQRHGAELGLDPARTILMGKGSGGSLAVMTALSLVEVGLPPRGVISLHAPVDFSTLDADMAALGRTPERGPADPADSRESRLLGFPIGANRVAARAAGPLARLDALKEALPPILIRHGDADPVVSDLQAKRLREAWVSTDLRAEVDYKLVQGAGHGGAPFETGEVRADILAFIIQALR